MACWKILHLDRFFSQRTKPPWLLPRFAMECTEPSSWVAVGKKNWLYDLVNIASSFLDECEGHHNTPHPSTSCKGLTKTLNTSDNSTSKWGSSDNENVSTGMGLEPGLALWTWVGSQPALFKALVIRTGGEGEHRPGSPPRGSSPIVHQLGQLVTTLRVSFLRMRRNGVWKLAFYHVLPLVNREKTTYGNIMINRYNDYYNVTKAIINHQYVDGFYHQLMVNSGIVDPLAVPRLGGLLSTKLSDAFRDHRSFLQQNEGLFRRDATTLGPVLKCDPQGDPVPMCDGCHCPTHLIFLGGAFFFHRYI